MDKSDIELALEDLEIMVSSVNKTHDIIGFLNVVHSANIIKKALDKQNSCPVEFNNCPLCNQKLQGHENYCPNCGQKIYWK